MAVLIASDVRKDLQGDPLFTGISFKLEARDRMTLSGRNGAGKTTLLRMLAGEESIDGGELVFAKGAKVKLHDQRPPRDRGVTLEDYILSGAPELLALEARLADLERRMADGDYEESTLNAYADAQAELEIAGGYTWREDALSTLHGLGFNKPELLSRTLATFSGGELTRASLARALAGSPDLLLLDEPTNHLDIASLEWLENHLNSLEAAIVIVAHDPLVPRGRRHVGARARGGTREVLPGHLASVEAGEGRPRACPRTRDREAAGRDRQAGEVRGPVQRRYAFQAGAVTCPQTDGDGADRARRQGRRRSGLRLQAAGTVRSRRLPSSTTAR